VGTAREAAAESVAAQVKSEKIKGEIRIKGVNSEQNKEVKGELGEINAGESFDWRRDLPVRFGEPQELKVRDRTIMISCRIKSLSFSVPRGGNSRLRSSNVARDASDTQFV
jgi:hypothetical protein